MKTYNRTLYSSFTSKKICT